MSVLVRAALAVALVVLSSVPGLAETKKSSGTETRKTTLGRVTGLPLPRFVSLRSRAVNMRVGPGRKYKIAWLYKRPGLPVEVIQEFDRWRKIRDADGTEGWVMHSLLTRRRTALVRTGDEPVPALRKPADDASTVARMGSGLLVSVKTCDGTWCSIDAKGHKGYVRKAALWGVYPNETVED